MKIILSSESKKWSWSLRNGGFELARCELYDNFIDARINAEAFRIGARSPVTLDAHVACALIGLVKKVNWHSHD
ncbi:hypothetical protein F0067_07005 [Salmonella enterica]|nr:hypothetical protein [Salmonella enterica]EDT1811654.1 hypothetical protein [Salmonella enterica subsp. enterica serovar Javiana]EAO1917218.1 hypothetical protein [Salmonella enterica]EAR7593686.1 hypothetical protein [Salmonella enterica]EAT9401179.1 hypothetical protein [Salmonella enterica]